MIPVLVVDHISIDVPSCANDKHYQRAQKQPYILMVLLLQVHELVHADGEVCYVKSTANLNPHFITPTWLFFDRHQKSRNQNEDVDR